MYRWQSFHSKRRNQMRTSASDLHLENMRSRYGIRELVSGPSVQSASIIISRLEREGFSRLLRGCSSAGRAPDLHSGGRRFDPDQLHQFGFPGL